MDGGRSKNLNKSEGSDKSSVKSASVNASGSKNNKIKAEDTKQSKNNKKSNVQKANDSESDKGKAEKDDVPEDFFDDFLKEDFMAGLDIVDEDNEDTEDTNANLKVQVSDKKISKKEAQVSGKSQTKVDHVKKFKQVPPEEKNKASKVSKKVQKKKSREDELKRLDRELEEIRNAPFKRPEKVGIDADNFDIRRDPEKTRQAIQRDKIKSAKDKEKKLITDIVQTGLVPPGMELEVDIENVCRTEKRAQITDLREKIRPRKSRSKSFDSSKKLAKKFSPSARKRSPSGRKHHTPSKRRRSPSPRVGEKLNEVKQSYGRNHSPSRRHSSPRYKRSPVTYRSSPRHYSPEPIRNPDRSSPPRRNIASPVWSPKRSPIRRSGGPLSWRRSRSKSPANRRSPNNISRHRDISRTRRGRDHSYSPLEKARRRRSHSRSPKRTKKEEKVSFLEELVAKLNETHPVQANVPYMPPHVNYMMPNMNPPIAAPVQPMVQQPQTAYFTPAPVPQPTLVQPRVQQTMQNNYDPYDESFFIGNTSVMPSSGSGQFKIEDSSLVKAGPIQPQNINKILPRRELDKDASKLFGDKRIMLSDFLAITAKPQVNNASSSAKLQEKIKVIQRCQDAIKILNEKKFTGPLIVHKTDSHTHSTDMTLSPLLRKPIVQLPFTTPGMKNSIEMNFTKCCETLLHRVGLPRKIAPEKQDKGNMVPPKEITPKAIPLITLTKKDDVPPPTKVITKSLSTQTDKELSCCKECLRRKGILYANCGVQAGAPMLTFSVSTQVTEADFYSMIPKTQSLASLTPAQLLGKQSMISDFNKSSNSFENSRNPRNMGGRQVPSPPPPPTFHFPISNIQSQQGDSYSHLFGQPIIPSLMQNRVSIPPNKTFSDDRRGVFNKRF